MTSKDTPKTDEEHVDEFFAKLVPKIKKQELTAVPPPPSPELLALIEQSVKPEGKGNDGLQRVDPEKKLGK